MASYVATPGDTFARISRRVYGDESRAGTIRAMNPDVQEPITPGLSLVIPPGSQLRPTTTETGTSVVIGSSRWRYWSEVTIARTLDSIDTATVSGPFEPDDAAMREAFRPFQYPDVTVLANKEAVFSGVMVAPIPSYGAMSSSVTATCYSRPGPLNDCTPSAASLPLAFKDSNLDVIAAEICKPFGVKVFFEDDPGPVFDIVACRAEDKVLPFLVKLARQRGLLVSNDTAGELVFFKPKISKPSTLLKPEQPPVISVTPVFKGQAYYSHISGIEPVVAGLKGSVITKSNAHLKGAFRPLTFEAKDVDTGGLAAAVDAKMGRMLGDSAVYNVEVSTWTNPEGRLWTPGDIISLHAPRAMVYEPYHFMIRSVTLSADAVGRSATLALVVPEAYSGGIPQRMPWEG